MNTCKKITVAILIIVIGYCIVAHNQCEVTSYQGYRLCDTLGFNTQVCCGELSCTAEYDHAWIRVNGFNVETCTLNLIKSRFCDYDNPYFSSDDIIEIENELYGDNI